MIAKFIGEVRNTEFTERNMIRKKFRIQNLATWILRSWSRIILKFNKRHTLYFEISPLFPAVILIMYFSEYLEYFVLIFLSMLFHELGHTVSAIIAGRKVYCIKILPIGLNVSLEEFLSSKCEKIIIYICGPLVNLLLIFFFLWLKFGMQIDTDIVNFLAVVNIYLIVFNLLPALPFDGGKILREVLTTCIGANLSNKIMRILSMSICTILILLGTIQFLNSIFNFSLLLIGFYLFFLLKLEKVEAAMMNVKDVIYRRSRLLKKGVYPARDLVVVKTMHLSDIIKCLDFDRFHIIHVLNEDLKLIKVFTEQDIIDAVLKYSSDMTFDEFITKNV